MKLLLDSHILIWWPVGSPRLGARAKALIADPDNQLFMSAANWWELGIKRALGRLQIDLPEATKAIERRGVVGLSVTMRDAEFASTLERLHGDPFDHMLVAQAQAGGMKLLTRDTRLKEYGASVLCV